MFYSLTAAPPGCYTLVMATFETTHAWEKRANETALAYQRFLGWLEWPGKLNGYAGHLGGQLDVNPDSIVQQAYKHDWRPRKEEWLKARVGTQEEPTAEEEAKFRNRARSRVRYHAALAEKFLTKAERLVDHYMEQEVLDEEGNPTGETKLVRGVLREASEALAKGMEMERLAHGLPGTITRIEHDLRQQVEVSLNIYQKVLAIVAFHVCDACRASIEPQLIELEGEVTAAQSDVAALSIGDAI